MVKLYYFVKRVFYVNSLLATSSFTTFHILFITFFSFARFTPHTRLHKKKNDFIYFEEKTLFTCFLGLRGKEKRTEENESNTLSRNHMMKVTYEHFLRCSITSLYVNKKYLELRIRVIIIMKLNEPIKQHINFGLHYIIC